MSQAIDQNSSIWRASIQRIGQAFSLSANIKKLTAPRKPRLSVKSATNIQQLYSLDFLRVVSTLWILIIHSYSFALSWMKFDDTQSKRDVYKSLPAQFLANGTFSVDNFYLMSGFLTLMRHLNGDGQVKEIQRAGNFLSRLQTFAKFSLRRYARLVPLMMLMILFSIIALPQLSNGQEEAKWLIATEMFDQWCRANWPINLLLAHNFFQTQQMCFSHSWYVAVDFQLFLIFELFIFLSNTNLHALMPTMIFSISMISIGQLTSTIVTYYRDLPAIPLVPAASQQSIMDFYKYIYIKPFHWAASYFIGIMLAKVVLGHKLRGKFVETFRVWLNFASVVLIFLIIFSNYSHFQQESPMSREYASLYSLLARPIWSLCVACLITLSQVTGSKFLSSTKRRILSSLSRLSYSVYLLHPVQMATFYGNRLETFHFSHYLLLYFTIGNIVLNYLGATLIYLLVELPIQNLLQANEKRTISKEDTNKRTGNRLSGQYELRSIASRAKV